MIRQLILILSLLIATLAPTVHAQDYQSSPPRQDATPRDFGPYLGPYRAKVTARMLEDFGEQYLYAPQNAALPAPAPDEQRVVFLGDSITDRWNLAKFFPGKPYVNRGIGGQVTTQMLVRFHADVVALHPAAVVILAGINDVQGVFQVETEQQIETNYEAMAELAQAHGIKPIFTEIMPVNNYTPNAATVLQDRHPDELARINAWLAAYCAAHHDQLIDYGPVLRDDKGLMRADYTSDGIHPTDQAYAVMAPLAEQAIAAALAKP
ncbi:GDSL-type esterase/lipase family protein [Asticcacaulis sp. EMRT-3]|uniref:GDSL-type esterase/lipase family protein n=1 Tax=Asticcacaulis sp. EMRT-3 TaxID=3040349 RepID=UPI0024AEE733|nr:GDSL-type esterase/lipase family protein [Asticcacaulis sp. EMRT-3]MDI7776300.1 GDSL-type esterase/lipase family protein [Asticcacaulis sp. EMRT-3]